MVLIKPDISDTIRYDHCPRAYDRRMIGTPLTANCMDKGIYASL
jgi:hypothetical protein